MRRGVCALLAAALASATLAIGAGPAAADVDQWGFTSIHPGSASPGSTILAEFHSQSSWDTYDPATDTASPEFTAESASCGGGGHLDLYDRAGARVAVGGPVPRIAPGTEPGTYFLRAECVVAGELRAACAEFEVTASGTGPDRRAVAGGSVIHDPCPVSKWGFMRLDPPSAPPGSYIVLGISSREFWDYPDTTDFSTNRVAAALSTIVEGCNENSRKELYAADTDSTGHLIRGDRVAAQAIATEATTVEYAGGGTSLFGTGSTLPLRIPDGLAPGTYFVRETCTAADETHTVCTQYYVTASGHGAARVVPHGSPLIDQPCPVSFRLMFLESILRVRGRFGVLGDRLFAAAPAGADPVTTTTTVVPISGRSPVPATAPPTAPPADTTAPVVTIGSINTMPPPPKSCTGAVVSWSATDNVGVVSSTISWSGTAGSGSIAGGTSGPTTIGPLVAGTFVVTVQARDAAGNVGSRTGLKTTCA